MRSFGPKIALVLLVGIVLIASPGSAQIGAVVSNWTPASMTYTGGHHAGITTMSDVTSPLPFIGVTPCRIVDTRGAAGTFGGPALVAGVPRNFPLVSGPCGGLPAAVAAYSLNITVANTQGPGFILIYPQGGSQPLVSTLNYVAGQSIANAAIVPAGTSGGVTVVAGVSGTDLIIDINGYFSATPGTAGNYFRILNNSFSYSIFTDNASTSCPGPCGIRADIESTTDAFSIAGYANGATGKNHAVHGETTSTDNGTAGVWGIDGAPTTGATLWYHTGVRGDSKTGYGFQGVSEYNGGQGILVNSSGSLLTVGWVGYSGVTNYAFYGTGGYAGTGPKYFIEPHPQDANQVIRYIAMEGPRSYTHITGRARAQSGIVRIEVPEDFRFVTDTEDLNAQCTPHGQLATCAVMSLDLNEVVFAVSKNVEVSWSVTGIRRTFKDLQPIGEGREFVPETPEMKMPLAFSPAQRALLIQNGTYNSDGTVNMETAARLGWTTMWQQRAEQARAAAQAARAAAADPQR